MGGGAWKLVPESGVRKALGDDAVALLVDGATLNNEFGHRFRMVKEIPQRKAAPTFDVGPYTFDEPQIARMPSQRADAGRRRSPHG